MRYADDFVVTAIYRCELEDLIHKIDKFLKEGLKLELHPDKVYIKTLASGVDFLGWVHFPDHRVLRTVTKRRMLKKLLYHISYKSVESYKGMLRHGNTKKLKNQLNWLYGQRGSLKTG